ncbi:hypothetical protein B8W90_13595, partial [Staphylococcus hominis]
IGRTAGCGRVRPRATVSRRHLEQVVALQFAAAAAHGGRHGPARIAACLQPLAPTGAGLFHAKAGHAQTLGDADN